MGITLEAIIGKMLSHFWRGLEQQTSLPPRLPNAGCARRGGAIGAVDAALVADPDEAGAGEPLLAARARCLAARGCAWSCAPTGRGLGPKIGWPW